MSTQLSILQSPSSERPRSWKDVLSEEREKEYFRSIMGYIEEERANGKTIYPPNSEIFRALHLTPFDQVRAVILGQDPYHGPNQAHGLCFSVRPEVAPPPSLVNIFQELSDDLSLPKPQNGSLEKWAMQGVLLLNTALTVEAGNPQSHSGIGWEQFTDRVVEALNEYTEGIVFILWGSHAQKKGKGIDTSRHCVIKSPHPSPLSAYRGFFGSKPFSKANDFLRKVGKPEIDWNLAV